MINPLRSEEDAFRFTVIVAILVAPVALTAVIFGSDAAAAVAAGMVIGGLFVLVILRRREQPREKMRLRRPVADERHRILVVANETLQGRALRDEIAHRSRDRGAEIWVVCPALNTKIKHWVSDEDEARAAARGRLEEVVGMLRSDGFQADGDVGDGDPVQAMEDALRLFRADEAIISTHPLGRSNWLEADVVGRARERFPIPITHVVVDLDREFVARRA